MDLSNALRNRPSKKGPLRSLLVWVCVLGLFAAGCGGDDDAPLEGASFTLQNYFTTPDAEGNLKTTPFFDEIEAAVGDKIEVEIADTNYLYEFDLTGSTITMSWNPNPSYDQYEPYVGAGSGRTREEAAALQIADEYFFTFNRDISDVTFTLEPGSSMMPVTRVEDGRTLVIKVPGGSDIGDGRSATIMAS